MYLHNIAKDIKKLADKFEEGRMVELPCNFGDTLSFNGREWKVTEFTIPQPGVIFVHARAEDGSEFHFGAQMINTSVPVIRKAGK
jgi:hypothetical protein